MIKQGCLAKNKDDFFANSFGRAEMNIIFTKKLAALNGAGEQSNIQKTNGYFQAMKTSQNFCWMTQCFYPA